MGALTSACPCLAPGPLQVGKPLAALEDAQLAVTLDPKFFRAVSRAATCHCR